MCVVPFVFVWKGPRLRELSGFCRALREGRERAAQQSEEEGARAGTMEMGMGVIEGILAGDGGSVSGGSGGGSKEVGNGGGGV